MTPRCFGIHRSGDRRSGAGKTRGARSVLAWCWLFGLAACACLETPAGRAAEAPSQALGRGSGGISPERRGLAEAARRANPRSPQAAATEQRLIELLGDDSDPEAQEFLCRQLRLIGTAAAVPALERLLPTTRLSAAARTALEVIPDPAATRALTNALPGVEGALRLGIINSLGARQDPAAVPALQSLLASPRKPELDAALAALGKVGDETAVQTLVEVAAKLDPSFGEIDGLPNLGFRAEATNLIDTLTLGDALLVGADTVAAAGGVGLASEVYRRVYASPIVPRQCRVAALHGALRWTPTIALPVVLSTLQIEDPAIQGIGLSLARQFSPAAVTLALQQFDDLTPAGQAALIGILTEREEPELGPRFLEWTRSKEPVVRQAAIRALPTVEVDAGTVQRLAEIAATADPATALAAREALPRLRGPEVEPAIREGVTGAVADLRVELIHAMAARRMSGAVPSLVEAATTSNDAVRIAALNALALLAEPAHYPLLVEFLRAANSSEEEAAALAALRAVGRRVDDRDQCAQLLASVYEEARAPLKLQVLDLLGTLGGNAALRLVASTAAQEPNTRLRHRAIEVLAAWPDTAAIQHLFAVANSAAEPQHRVLALQGYLRLLALPTDRTVSETARLHRLAIAVAKAPDDYRRILAGLARLPSVEALDTVEPFLADDDVREDAARAILAISPGTAAEEPERTAQALRRAAARTQSAELKTSLESALERLGTPDGMLRAWMVSEPYTAPGNPLAQPFDPETRLEGIAWQPLIAPDGEATLDDLFPRESNVAYLRAVLRAAKPSKARLDLRSEDGVKVWLSGRVILAREPSAAANQDGEGVELALRPGNNALLVKLARGPETWRLSARVTDADGNPVTGLRSGVE